MLTGETPLPPPPPPAFLRWSSSVLGSDVLYSEVQILLSMYPGQAKALLVQHAPSPSIQASATLHKAHDDDDDGGGSNVIYPPAHKDPPSKDTPCTLGGGSLGTLPATQLNTGQAIGAGGGGWAPLRARFGGGTPEAVLEARCLLLKVGFGSSGFDTLPVQLQELLWRCGNVTPQRLESTTTGGAGSAVQLTAYQSVHLPRVQDVALSFSHQKVDAFRLTLHQELTQGGDGGGASSTLWAPGSTGAPSDADVELTLTQRDTGTEAALLRQLSTSYASTHFLWAALRVMLEMTPAPEGQKGVGGGQPEQQQLVRVAFPDEYPQAAPVLVTRLHKKAWSKPALAADMDVGDDPPLQPHALPPPDEEAMQREVAATAKEHADSGAGVMIDVLQVLQEHTLRAANKAEHDAVRLRFSRAVGRAGSAAWRHIMLAMERGVDGSGDPLAPLLAIMPPSSRIQNTASAAAAGAGASGAELGAPLDPEAAYHWALNLRDMVAQFIVRQGCLIRAQLLLLALRVAIQRALKGLPPRHEAHPAAVAARVFLEHFTSLRAVTSSLMHEPVVYGETHEDVKRARSGEQSALRSASTPELWSHFGLSWSKLSPEAFLGPRMNILKQLAGRYGILEMHDVFRPEAAMQFMTLWQKFQLRYGVHDIRARVSVGYCRLKDGVLLQQVANNGLEHELSFESMYPDMAHHIRTYESYGEGTHSMNLRYRERSPTDPYKLSDDAYGYPDYQHQSCEREHVFSLTNTPSAAERLHQSVNTVEEWAHHGNGKQGMGTPNFRIVVCAVLRGVTHGRESDMQACVADAVQQAWADDPDSQQAQRFQSMRTELLSRASVRQGSVVDSGRSNVYDSDTEAWQLGPPPHNHTAAPGAVEANGAPWQRWHCYETAQVLPCYVLHLVPLRVVADHSVAPHITHAHIVTGGGALAKAPRHALESVQQQAIDKANMPSVSRTDAYNARLKNASYFLGSRFSGLIQVAPLDEDDGGAYGSDDDEWGAHGMRSMPIITAEQATRTAGVSSEQMVFSAMKLPPARQHDVHSVYAKAKAANKSRLRKARRDQARKTQSHAPEQAQHTSVQGGAVADAEAPPTPRMPQPAAPGATRQSLVREQGNSDASHSVFRSLLGVAVEGGGGRAGAGRGRGGARGGGTGAHSRMAEYMAARQNTDYAAGGMGSVALERQLAAADAQRQADRRRPKADVLQEARQLQAEARAIASAKGRWGPQG